MKKALMFIAAVAAALNLVSCNKEQIETPSTDIKLNIKVANLDGSADTKAVKAGWSSGDEILIWYDENLSQDPDLVITYDGSKWAADHSAAVSGKNPSASGKLVAVYVEGGISEFTYTGDENSSRFAAPRFDSMVDDVNYPSRMPLISYVDRTDYSFESDILTANLSGWLFRGSNVQVVISDLPEGEWALSCDKFRTPYRLGITNNNPTIRVSVSAPSATGNYALSMANADGKAFMYYFSGADTDFTFTLFNTGTGERLAYSVSGKSLDVTGEKLNAIKIPFSKFYAIPLAVDLGLSVKWASFNVGAAKPEDYGYYFAWGETTPKNDYYASREGDYKWGVLRLALPPTYGMTKYTAGVEGGDGHKTLQPGDDAATANLGAKWRTPTIDEYRELADETKCEWIWDAEKKGYTVKSLTTGNSIFLPAAGERQWEDLHYAETSGEYWLSIVDEWTPYEAYRFFFSSGNHAFGSLARYHGLSVRAVTE